MTTDTLPLTAGTRRPLRFIAPSVIRPLVAVLLCTLGVPPEALALSRGSSSARPVDAQPSATDVRETKEWKALATLAPGARVRLRFGDGSEITGVLVEATEDSVTLRDKVVTHGRMAVPVGITLAATQRFDAGRLSRVAILDKGTGYMALGAPDARAVEGVAVALQNRGDVIVRMADGRQVRGRVSRVDADAFVIVHGQAAPEPLRFEDVRELRPSEHTARNVALFFGVGAAAVFVGLLVALSGGLG